MFLEIVYVTALMKHEIYYGSKIVQKMHNHVTLDHSSQYKSVEMTLVILQPYRVELKYRGCYKWDFTVYFPRYHFK